MLGGSAAVASLDARTHAARQADGRAGGQVGGRVGGRAGGRAGGRTDGQAGERVRMTVDQAPTVSVAAGRSDAEDRRRAAATADLGSLCLSGAADEDNRGGTVGGSGGSGGVGGGGNGSSNGSSDGGAPMRGVPARRLGLAMDESGGDVPFTPVTPAGDALLHFLPVTEGSADGADRERTLPPPPPPPRRDRDVGSVHAGGPASQEPGTGALTSIPQPPLPLRPPLPSQQQPSSQPPQSPQQPFPPQRTLSTQQTPSQQQQPLKQQPLQQPPLQQPPLQQNPLQQPPRQQQLRQTPERSMLPNSLSTTLCEALTPRLSTQCLADGGASGTISSPVTQALAPPPVSAGPMCYAASAPPPLPFSRDMVPGSGLSLAAVEAQFAPPPPPPRGGRAGQSGSAAGSSGLRGDCGPDVLGDAAAAFPVGSPFTADLFTLPPPSPPLRLQEEEDVEMAQAAAAAVLDAVQAAASPDGEAGGWAASLRERPAVPPPLGLADRLSTDVAGAVTGAAVGTGTPPRVRGPVSTAMTATGPSPPKLGGVRKPDAGKLAAAARTPGGKKKTAAGTEAKAAVGSTAAVTAPTAMAIAADDEADADAHNPLRKEGRNLVITGRLPTSSPYQQALDSVGIRFVSAKLSGIGPEASPPAEAAAAAAAAGAGGREAAFLADHAAFMLERGHASFKVPVVGGGPLNIFRLFVEVCKLGGVENVLNKRAFRVVAGELDLPRTCTSAAFVLRNAHESLLYAYEQKLVFGRTVSMSDRPVRKGVDGKKKKKKSQPPLVPPLALDAEMQGVSATTGGGSGGGKASGAGASIAAVKRPSFPAASATKTAPSKAASATGRSPRAPAGGGSSSAAVDVDLSAAAVKAAGPSPVKAAEASVHGAAAGSRRRAPAVAKAGTPNGDGQTPKTPTTTIIVATPSALPPSTGVTVKLEAGLLGVPVIDSPLLCPSTRRPLRPLPATPPPRRPSAAGTGSADAADRLTTKRLMAGASPTASVDGRAGILGGVPVAAGSVTAKEEPLISPPVAPPPVRKPAARRSKVAVAKAAVAAVSPTTGAVVKARAPRPARPRASRAGRSSAAVAAKRERVADGVAAAVTTPTAVNAAAADPSVLSEANTRAILETLTMPSADDVAGGAAVAAASALSLPPAGVPAQLPPLPPLAVNLEALNAALRQYAAGASVPGLVPSVFEEAHAASVAAGAGMTGADYLPMTTTSLSAATTTTTTTTAVNNRSVVSGGGGGEVGGAAVYPPPPLPPHAAAHGYASPTGTFPCFRPLSSSPLPPLPWSRHPDETGGVPPMSRGVASPPSEAAAAAAAHESASAVAMATAAAAGAPGPEPSPPPPPSRSTADLVATLGGGGVPGGSSSAVLAPSAVDALLGGAPPARSTPPASSPTPASATEMRMSYMSGWFFSSHASHHKVYSPDDYILDSPGGADMRDG